MKASFFRFISFECSRTSIVALLGLLMLQGCSTLYTTPDAEQKQSLTPITSKPTNVYYSGKFVWHDLLTPDVVAAKSFYEKLFGWSFVQHGRYTEILNDGHKVGGMVEIKPENTKKVEAQWLMALSVTDVDKAVKYLEFAGGEVHKGPVDMINRGRGALVSDPQGAQLLLMRSSSGDPVDAEPAMGDWLWNEIWTNVPADTRTFYKALGKYDAVVDGENYQVLASAGNWRAGIRHVFESDLKVRWVPVVRVENPEALIDKVENLGGIVWLHPDEPPSKGDTALISDNTGALLMLQRWSPAKGGE